MLAFTLQNVSLVNRRVFNSWDKGQQWYAKIKKAAAIWPRARDKACLLRAQAMKYVYPLCAGWDVRLYGLKHKFCSTQDRFSTATK